jgi:hypothetical protein
MNKLSLFVLTLGVSANTYAVKLSEYRPYKFEVLFTNPVCATYSYDQVLTTESGKTIISKPDDVYCKPSDEAASVARNTSPQYRIIEWISDPKTKEVSLAYLSFSSKNVVKALCSAVARGVKISIVLDGGEDPGNQVLNKDAEGLKKCSEKNLVSITYRGSSKGLGYAHNKIMMINPEEKEVKILFSSGNMTGGTSINHENWNFVTTSGDSYFAQAHKCALKGMIEAGDAKANFSSFMNTCRSKIVAKPETDVEVYFSPVDGGAAFNRVKEAISKANLVEGMSHRLSGKISELLSKTLETGKKIKFIMDDDIYWSVKRRQDVGRNSSVEAFRIYRDLINKGLEMKFLQTNQNVFQLQHNKFFIFHMDQNAAVFSGAGNFTSAAFEKNFENFYYITIPEVVEAYKKQYRKYYDEMATAGQDMPRDYVLP